MSEENSSATIDPWVPPRPNLVAAGLLSLGVILLSLPMLRGNFLAGVYSDQYATGFAFRAWGAAQWTETGSIPLWNPTIFGGMPFVGAMHGDIFYPTSWLRLVFSTVTAMNLAFLLHYILAGFFTYLFVRKLKASWAGAVVAGFAYQLSGVVGSYVQPGHDGKLFVTALLPLALISLLLAIRDRRLEGFGLLALTVGLGILSPHYQMIYYVLIVAGIFTLYLTFGEQNDRPIGKNLADIGLAALAVALGFGIAMIQMLPFYNYIPFSPRAEGYRGFEGSASYAVPWSHVPEFFLSAFVGDTPSGTYWGTNPLKLHSEYLGLPTIALAILGVLAKERRRLILWLGGVGGLFLLISLGAATPFYKVWWSIMPFVKQTRAPGMALFVVAFVIATLAAFGVEEIEKNKRKPFLPLIVGGAVVALFGLIGVFGALAESLLQGRGLAGALPAEIASQIRSGATVSGLALAALGGIGLLTRPDPSRHPIIPTSLAGVAILFVVAGDLWINAKPFWDFSEPPTETLASDAILDHVSQTEGPYRVMDLGPLIPPGRPVYQGSWLMALDIPQLLGHHGNELHNFDQLMGGKNIWNNLRSAVTLNRLMDLYSVRYVIVPAEVEDAGTILFGFEQVMSNVVTGSGMTATLYERPDARYARFVPGAVQLPDEQGIHTLMLPNFPTDAVITLPQDAEHVVPQMDSIPDPREADVTIENWAPGAITVKASTDADGYIMVAENHYRDWKATIDGDPVNTLRADNSLLAVPVSAGQNQTIEFEFVSQDYGLGKVISLVSLLFVGAWMVGPMMMKKGR